MCRFSLLRESRTLGSIDTIMSDSDEIDELKEELKERLTPDEQQCFESPLSVGSVFRQESNDLDLARIINCDLAINGLTTFNTPKEIWTNVNKRCIEKFGSNNCIKDDVTISDITWACSTLSAYLNWNGVVDYHDNVRKWIEKINDFCSKSDLINFEESEMASQASDALVETSLAASLKTASKVSAAPAAPKEVTRKKCRFINAETSSEDDEDEENDYKNNTKNMKVIEKQELNSAQILLYKKGKNLREILLNSSEELTVSENSKLEIMNILNALTDAPIKVTNEKTAEDRILQWQEQELQCKWFRITAELYNLLHLMSLIQVYEDLIMVAEELKKNPDSNVKNIKNWVINFMRDKLKINKKREQRNRLGCNRLRKLFNEGITCMQLVQAGLRKCDFFTKQENYEIFLSQIPSLDTRNSISSSSSNERLSDVLDISQSRRPRLAYGIFDDNATDT
jgi:hypothetical protein